MKTTRTALALIATPLLFLTACAGDSATSTSTETVTTTTTTPSLSDTPPAPTTTTTPATDGTTTTAPATGTTTAAAGTALPAEDFLVGDGIYTIALDESRGCNFHPEYWSCGVIANTNNGVASSGGMLGVQLRQNGFNTYEAGGQPFLGGNYLQPGNSVTLKGTTITHQADGTMHVKTDDQWFQVQNGNYTSNLNTPAARGEIVNTGELCGDFLYGIGGNDHAELYAGTDGVNCAIAMERITSYYTPQINNSPYGPGEGDITLRGGSKCTDKHQVDGQTTQACTAADGSQLAYLKRY